MNEATAVEILAAAARGERVAVFGLDSLMAHDAFRDLEAAAQHHAPDARCYRANGRERVELLSGRVTFHSLTRGNVRGYSFHRVYVPDSEAVPVELWPLLAVTNGTVHGYGTRPRAKSLQHDYPAISRSSLHEVCDLLGLRPSEVGTIHIAPEEVTVTGEAGALLVLPVVRDV